MNGGGQIESLYAMTGMPGYKLENSKLSIDDLWKYLSESDQKNYIITGSVMGAGDK